MKVILIQDVDKLGKKDDVVNAKTGYAKNYLIPNGLAVEATKTNLKKLKEKKANEAEEAAYELAQAEAIRDQLDEQKVVIKTKSGQGGKLFGTITNQEVAAAIKEEYRVDIDRRKIVLDDKIKNLGTTQATIKLHPEVRAQIYVQVIDPEA